VTGWQFWLLVALAVAVVVLAAFAVLLLAGTLVVSAREAAAERERGVEA
jgi:hypothetical protein